jgi:DNA-binding Xre family transcriptional regulator
MTQTRLIIDTLKRELRKQGLRYRQVADRLDISEASVKRLFARGSFSLDRLGQVCELLNLEISDLIHQMEKDMEMTQQLTLEQETELVSNIKLMLMAHFLINRFSFEEIIAVYDISRVEGIRLLAKLDRMKIIDLLPGNRVKLMIDKDFRIIPGGPIQDFFEERIQQQFFDSAFDGHGEYRMFATGFFSRGGNEEIIRKMKQLSRDAHQIMQESEELPLEERFGCSFIMATRPWEINAFDALRRKPDSRIF